MRGFAEVEDKYNILYIRGKPFTVHMPTQDVVFKRGNKLYVGEWCAEDSMPDTAVNVMVQENKQLYMKEEAQKAQLAHNSLGAVDTLL